MTHPNPPPITPGRAVATEATGLPYPHSLLLSLGTVTEEEESSGKEEHATQDHDEGAEHEGVAQTQELPERGVLGALADQVRDLRGSGADVRVGPPTQARHPPLPLGRRTHIADEVGAAGIPQQVRGEALKGHSGGPSRGDDHILWKRWQVRSQRSQAHPPGLIPGVRTLLKPPTIRPFLLWCLNISLPWALPLPAPFLLHPAGLYVHLQLMRPGCLRLCTGLLVGSQVQWSWETEAQRDTDHTWSQAPLGPEP